MTDILAQCENCEKFSREKCEKFEVNYWLLITVYKMVYRWPKIIFYGMWNLINSLRQMWLNNVILFFFYKMSKAPLLFYGGLRPLFKKFHRDDCIHNWKGISWWLPVKCIDQWEVRINWHWSTREIVMWSVYNRCVDIIRQWVGN